MNKIWQLLREGEPGAEGAEEVKTDPPATEQDPPVTTEPTEAEKELAAVKAENELLKAEKATPPAQPQAQVSSATLENYSEDQWSQIEAKTGKDRATIIRDFKDYEMTNRQNTIDAKNNVTEALQDELEKNPKLLKLRGTIKEFMADVPMADRLDPAKLKRAMDKAIIYARGKHMTSETPAPANKPKPNADPNPAGDDDGAPQFKEGEIKDDTYISNTGTRIKTGKISKELWKKVQHTTRDANSVCIPSDFDEKPKFK